MSSTVFYENASEAATLTNSFAVAGVATDPTTIALTVTTPTGTATTYTYALTQITRTGAGVYTKDIVCSEDGLWTYLWVGTGTATDAVAGTWTVLHTELRRMYCSVEELKSRLGIGAADTADDLELRFAVEASSESIEEYCNRHFWQAAGTRTFVPDSLTACDVDDLVSVTTLATDTTGDGVYDTTWSTTDYQLWPTNPGRRAVTWPYTEVRAVAARFFAAPCAWPVARADRVQIAGVFGWPAVPSAVKQAALILSADHYKLKDAPGGVAGFGDFGPIRINENRRATALLGPYRRVPVMVG